MTDEERFSVVLRELGRLLVALRTIGLDDDVVLIGAQVVALEQVERGLPPFSSPT